MEFEFAGNDEEIYAIKTAKCDFRQSSGLGYIEYILDRLFEFERE
jgi:hypothetical protein